MKECETVTELSLIGGPLHWLGRRLGLVRGENTLWFGVAVGLLAWSVLMLLTLPLGLGHKAFALSVIGAHVRLLVAIPLLFLCETWVVPRMAEFAHTIVRSGLVPGAGLPALDREVRRVRRLSASWLAEGAFLLVAFTLPLITEFIGVLPGRTADLTSLRAESGGRDGSILIYYAGFCLPLFRFLVLRWLWRLGLWWSFLWRVQRLDLRLIPTHPDRSGGLGYLEIVQEHFTPLVMAISAVYAASFAEDIAAGAMPFESLYRVVPVLLLLIAALFVGPLFFFSRKLWLCRITGWNEYMGMASRYVDAFDRRWIRDEKVTGESQLGTPDMQSLADLGNSVNVVREMQVIPAGRRLMTQLAVSAMLPLLPLVFLKYPVRDVATKLFQALTGL